VENKITSFVENHFKNNTKPSETQVIESSKFKNDQLEQVCKSNGLGSKGFNRNLNLINQRLLFDISHKPKSYEQSLLLLPMEYFIRRLSVIFMEKEAEDKNSCSLNFDIPPRFWFLCKSQICRNYSPENNGSGRYCKFGRRCWFVFFKVSFLFMVGMLMEKSS
jgi:hypothetical protein